MGKSRLIQEFLGEANDVVVVRGPSASYESQTPYFPFRMLLRDIFRLRPSDDAAASAVRLTEQVESVAPQLQPWLPLLGVVLCVELTPTKETGELDERFRSAKLEEVLVEFLVSALDRPSVVIFENTHLTDVASVDMFKRLEAEVEPLPWLVLVTRRDAQDGFVPEGVGGGYARLTLAPIDGSDALHLLDAATGAATLSSEAMEARRQFQAQAAQLFMQRSGSRRRFSRCLIEPLFKSAFQLIPSRQRRR
jgi:predicted ATPase